MGKRSEAGYAGGVRIELNGQPREVPDGTTVAALLALFALDVPRLAVEVNARVVARARHQETALAPGDRVEIVTFVGGG